MKKAVILFLSLTIFSVTSFADYMAGLEDGRYLGAGAWSDTYGQSGSYQTYVEFAANEMRVDYAWADGNTTTNISFWFNADGWFNVAHQGYEVGAGFCMEFQCHYEINLNGNSYAETLTFFDDRLHKLGYKTDGDRLVRWEEVLHNLSYPDPEPPVPPVEEDPADPVEP